MKIVISIMENVVYRKLLMAFFLLNKCRITPYWIYSNEDYVFYGLQVFKNMAVVSDLH